MRRLFFAVFVYACFVCGSAGCCGGRHVAPADVADAWDLTGPTSYVSEGLGISLTLPAGWMARASRDYVLVLSPAGASEVARQSVSLDVPDLPPHIPGLIPIGLVRNGYVDDLRKQFGEVRSREEPPPAVGKAKARLVHSTWKVAGRGRCETALLMVRGDRVYILRVTADADAYAETRAAFDAVAASIRWTK